MHYSLPYKEAEVKQIPRSPLIKNPSTMRELLPPELYIQIINTVGRLASPDSYRTPNTSSLSNLSRVNHAFHLWSNSVLYSKVCITPANLLSFRRSVVASRSETDSDSPQSFIPTARGLSVRSLALIRFYEEPTLSQIRNIALIFYALSNTLERLLLDVFLRPIDYKAHLIDTRAPRSLREATRGLSKIREFCSTQQLPWSMDPMPWESHSTMETLVLLNISLHYRLTDSMACFKRLQKAAVAFPSLTGTQVLGSPLEIIFDVTSSDLKELMLVTALDDKMYINGFKKLVGEVMESGYIRQSGNGDRLSIAGVEGMGLPAHLDSRVGQERWFLDALLEGTFWEVERHSWDTFLKSLKTDGN